MGSDFPQGLAPEQLVGERIAGRFVVERLIGHGPLSTAFRAHDDRLHRRVTVKLFHPRHRDDVHVVESQLAVASKVARLAHEHIAVVIDRGEHDGMPLIVLEFVRGENLHERIERFAPLGVAECVGYGLQIARALTYAHGQSVVHGNLRPENVLLTEDRDVKLVDFGGGSYVAQLVGDPFAAPELSEVDPGTPAEPTDDIYALGALLFVALSEHTPPAGIGAADVQAVRPDVSPRLASAIAQALATDPADRHRSMRDFAAELASAQAALGGALPGAGGASSAVDTLPGIAGATQAMPVVEPVVEARVAPARAPRRRYAGETRARLLAWSMVLVPIAALVIVGLMISGERASDQVDSKRPHASAGPVRQVTPASATTFDPKPLGDGSEHEADVANVIDGDPKTTWDTEGYDLASLSNVKPGVGIILSFDQPQEIRDVRIVTPLPGWTVELRAADSLAPTLAGWKQVSKPVAVSGGEQLPVDLRGRSSRYLLVWITRLAIDVEDTNKFRARIGEIQVYATATGEATTSPSADAATDDATASADTQGAQDTQAGG